MYTKKLVALALLLVVIFTGCTFQKRSYRKGYYVQWNSTKNKNTTKESKASEVIPLSYISSKQFNEPVSASLDDKLILLPKKILEDSIKEICNDSIWTKEGAVSLVKILEITKTEIKYKRCSNINGPTIVVSQNSISKIKYANGMIESYNIATEIPIENIQEQRPIETKPKTQLFDIGNIAGIFGIIFLLCGVLALFFLFSELFIAFGVFVGLGVLFYFGTWVTSILALSKIKNSPKEFKGKGKAIAALIFVAAYTVLVLFALLLLLLIISGL